MALGHGATCARRPVMPSCIEWAEERHEECSDTSDEGYSECDDWDGNCCTWWPCSWACEVVTWVCVGWTWVSHVVCVAWNVVTTVTCVAWDVVTTAINAVIVTLESSVGWVLSAVAFLVELAEAIPGVGTLIRWIINFINFLAALIYSLVDILLGFLGVRPEKLLRVCSVVLRDEKGNVVANTPYAVQQLARAVTIFKAEANIRIIPSRPFHYTSGFSAAETPDDSWVVVDSGVSDSDLLDPACNGATDWGLAGSKNQLKMSTACFYGAWRRIWGYGSPVACVFIREIAGDTIGCAIWITDIAWIEGDILHPEHTAAASSATLGHEVGHAGNLWHIDDDPTNLMFPSVSGGDLLEDWQVLLLRASRHVTYF